MEPLKQTVISPKDPTLRDRSGEIRLSRSNPLVHPAISDLQVSSQSGRLIHLYHPEVAYLFEFNLETSALSKINSALRSR